MPIIIFIILIAVIPFWKILSKAGFNPALSLLLFVPVLNVALLYYVAFTEWPNQKDNS